MGSGTLPALEADRREQEAFLRARTDRLERELRQQAEDHQRRVEQAYADEECSRAAKLDRELAASEAHRKILQQAVDQANAESHRNALELTMMRQALKDNSIPAAPTAVDANVQALTQAVAALLDKMSEMSLDATTAKFAADQAGSASHDVPEQSCRSGWAPQGTSRASGSLRVSTDLGGEDNQGSRDLEDTVVSLDNQLPHHGTLGESESLIALLALTVTAPSPPDVRMFGNENCTFVTSPRASLQRILVQPHYLQLPPDSDDSAIIDMARAHLADLMAATPDHELLVVSLSPRLPYPAGWSAPGNAPVPTHLMVIRMHFIPVALVRRSSMPPPLIREFVTIGDSVVAAWHGRNASAHHVSMGAVVAKLVTYSPRNQHESAVGAALWTLLSHANTTAPLFRAVRPLGDAQEAPGYGDGPRQSGDRQPDLKKLLYFQILNLPGQPLASWPAKSSLQAWHLHIINYFASGAVGISFTLLAQFGPKALLSNIVTLIIDKSCTRFERLRTLYSACEDEIFKLVDESINHITTLVNDGATMTEQQSALVLALCHIMLFLRAGPYGRDSERMARVEIRRLRDVQRPSGIPDGAWLIEMDSRHRQWRRLLGSVICVSLEDELRDLLHNVAIQLDTAESKSKFIQIVGDFMEAWARQHHGGNMADIPGLREISRARRVTVGQVTIDVKHITKITDLYMVHEVGKSSGDAGQLISTVLQHVIKSWDPDEYPVNLLGTDGQAAPDVVLLADSADDPHRRAVLASSSVRIRMNKDALSDVCPFPALDNELPSSATRDNLMAAMEDRDSRASRTLALNTPTVDTAALLDRIERMEHAAAARDAQIDLHISETSKGLSHLGQLARANAENGAHPDLRHARNEPTRTADRVQAIAVDTTLTQTAPPPRGRFDARTRLANDVRQRNMGTSARRPGGDSPRSGNDGARRERTAPPVDENGFRTILMSKKRTEYDAIAADAQTIISTKAGIRNKSDWDAKGGLPCPFCKVKDHDLFHCVKVWATTAAGKTWLGTTKAADFLARLALDNGSMLTVGEFIDSVADGMACQDCTDEVWDDQSHAIMYVADACGVHMEDDAHESAAPLVDFVSSMLTMAALA